MNDVTTYPPTVTTSVPPQPPTSTAFTGSPASVSWMIPAVIVLVVMSAAAWRIATSRAKRFDRG